MTQKQTAPSAQQILEALQKLLQSGLVGTQADISQAFETHGWVVNQSRISRLLRKLGAIKAINEKGESIYTLPKDPLLPSAQSSLSQLVVEISANETQVVIHTNPGSASLIAALLDQHRKALGILGTVAGDDVLFVVPESVENTKKMLNAIKVQLYG
jgi:transcriptional regulator of arginine metabolism